MGSPGHVGQVLKGGVVSEQGLGRRLCTPCAGRCQVGAVCTLALRTVLEEGKSRALFRGLVWP